MFGAAQKTTPFRIPTPLPAPPSGQPQHSLPRTKEMTRTQTITVRHIVSLILTWLLLTVDAHAGDVLSVPSEYATIASAIDAAADGDEIHVGPGTYTARGVVLDPLGKAIRILGVDGANTTIIDGEGQHQFVWFRNGEGRATILEGFTLRGGRYSGSGATRAGGCLRMSGASPTIRDCIFEDNIVTGTAWWTGAAVFSTGGSPRFESCLFRMNSDEHNEIAFFEDGCTPEFHRCVFAENTGICIEVQDGSRLLMSDSALVGNQSSPATGSQCVTLWNSPALSEIAGTRFLANRLGGRPLADCGHAVCMPNAYSGSQLLLSESIIHECGEGDLPIGPLPWDDGGDNTVGSPCIDIDCDQDGVIDAEAIWLGLVPDCNANWIPDDCDIAAGDLSGCLCPGDFDHDGDVDGADLGAWLAFVDAGCRSGSACPGDLDGDGEVRGSDLGLLLLNWGICD